MKIHSIAGWKKLEIGRFRVNYGGATKSAWYHKDTGEVFVGEEAPEDIENWIQDEDVLDTWFSCTLAVFNIRWPDTNADDFKRYYPTNALVTGYDIIFFW